MGNAHIELVYCDLCRSKVKGFRTFSSFREKYSKKALAKGATPLLLAASQISQYAVICVLI